MLTPYNKNIHNTQHMTTAFQTRIEDTTYNGWTNYETWNVSLWIGNDEGLYNIAREYRHLGYSAFANLMMDILDSAATPDGVAWNDDALNICELDEMMEEL
tara:strand:- start:582 stop:884 length:303 start_codon:yes stop_codon:yes gene_type:complete